MPVKTDKQIVIFSFTFLLLFLATIVILTAARAGHLVDALFHSEMDNPSALIRYNAIIKFQTLWRFRYQFWIRLEEGAHSMMKVNILSQPKKQTIRIFN